MVLFDVELRECFLSRVDRCIRIMREVTGLRVVVEVDGVRLVVSVVWRFSPASIQLDKLGIDAQSLFIVEGRWWKRHCTCRIQRKRKDSGASRLGVWR